MTVETATSIAQLDTTLPTAADMISEGDDHIRLLKTVLKTQFVGLTGPITVSQVLINLLGSTLPSTDYSGNPASTQFVVDQILARQFTPGSPVPDFVLTQQGII